MNTNTRSAEPNDDFAIDPIFDRHDIAYLLRRHWLRLLILPALCAALGIATFLAKPVLYESSALLMIDSSLDELLQTEQVGRGGSNVQQSLKSIEVALVADSVVLRVVDRLGLREEPGFLPDRLANMSPLPDAKLLDFLRKKRITASLQPETRLIRISVLDPDKDRARLVATTFLEEFESFLADQRRLEVKQVRAAIEMQVEEAKVAAVAAEEELKAFREETGLLPVEQDQDLFAERISQFGGDLNVAVRSRVELEGLYQSLADFDASESPIEIIEVAGYRGDTHISSMLTALANSRSRLAAAQERYTTSHPSLLSAQAEVARNEEQIGELALDIQKTAKARYDAAVNREQLLRDELAKLEKEYFQVKAQNAELRALQEDTGNRWVHYQSLQKRLSDNIISTEMPGNIATVISEPLTPHSAAGPPWILFAIVGGLFGAIVAGLFLVLQVVKGLPFTDRRQLEEEFPYPVLADWSRNHGAGGVSGSLLPFLVRNAGQLVHVCAPGLDGVVEPVTHRLASSLASTGRNVLVIEARPGVVDPSILQTSTPHLSRLEISPEDLYDETRFASVLPRLRQTYEEIFLEAGSAGEPLLLDWLSALCDREIVVVGRGRPGKKAIRKRVRRLGDRDPSKIGFLFLEADDYRGARSMEYTWANSNHYGRGSVFSNLKRRFRSPLSAA